MEGTKVKKSKLLLVAAILGVVYTVYIISYFASAGDSQDSVEALGAAIATALVAPHMVATLVAAVFNVLAWAMNKSAFALVAGILYAVAAVLFFTYAMFVVIEMILCFVAYAKMKKAK